MKFKKGDIIIGTNDTGYYSITIKGCICEVLESISNEILIKEYEGDIKVKLINSPTEERYREEETFWVESKHFELLK